MRNAFIIISLANKAAVNVQVLFDEQSVHLIGGNETTTTAGHVSVRLAVQI